MQFNCKSLSYTRPHLQTTCQPIMVRGTAPVLLLLLLLVTELATRTLAADYCSLCKPTATHSMCVFRAGEVSDACEDKFETSKLLTAEDKTAILQKHLDLRAAVSAGKVEGQPAAEDLSFMEWDLELELLAKRWAEQCLSKTEVCRQTKSDESYGQSINTKEQPDGFQNDFLNQIQSWFDEGKYFPSSHLANYTPPIGPDTSHYTQIVWANTSRIGCERSVWSNVEHLVCNYRPPGNVIGQRVYRAGSFRRNAGRACLGERGAVTIYLGLAIHLVYVTVTSCPQ